MAISDRAKKDFNTIESVLNNYVAQQMIDQIKFLEEKEQCNNQQ
jgi:hypothetical protein